MLFNDTQKKHLNVKILILLISYYLLCFRNCLLETQLMSTFLKFDISRLRQGAGTGWGETLSSTDQNTQRNAGNGTYRVKIVKNPNCPQINVEQKEMLYPHKLDGVGLVDNGPSNDQLHNFVTFVMKKENWQVTHDRLNVTHDRLNVTHDRLNVTHDAWHVTCDMWHMTRDTGYGVNILSILQLSRSNGLVFMMFWSSGGKGWVTQFMSDKGVCRTGPATPGLSKVFS